MVSGSVLTIHVRPSAPRTEVAGPLGDAVKIRLAAPPVDGAANEELVRFLAERLRVARADVEIVKGHTARRKQVRVRGLTAAAARQRLLQNK